MGLSLRLLGVPGKSVMGLGPLHNHSYWSVPYVSCIGRGYSVQLLKPSS